MTWVWPIRGTSKASVEILEKKWSLELLSLEILQAISDPNFFLHHEYSRCCWCPAPYSLGPLEFTHGVIGCFQPQESASFFFSAWRLLLAPQDLSLQTPSVKELIQPSASEERKTEDKCPHVPASGGTILSIPHMVSKKIPAGLAHSGHLLTCAPFITFSPVPVSPSPFPHLCFLRSPPVLVPALEKQGPRWD